MKTGNPQIDGSTAEWIIGSDEVGYGAWAGPLTVAGTLLPRGWNEPGVGDSKQLTPTQRRKFFVRFTISTPIRFHVASISPEKIDQLGVGQALYAAHREVLTELLRRAPGPALVVVDGFKDGTKAIGVPGAIGLPKADDLVPAVSLASIIAKVTRDEHMVKMADKYPGFGFGSHKGYGTPQHMRALALYGPCEIHRKSYAPIAKAKAAKALPVTFDPDDDFD
jgi:ribonuclease HII